MNNKLVGLMMKMKKNQKFIYMMIFHRMKMKKNINKLKLKIKMKKLKNLKMI